MGRRISPVNRRKAMKTRKRKESEKKMGELITREGDGEDDEKEIVS